MRELSTAESAVSSRPQVRRNWGDRQRIAFLLGLLGLFGLVVAGYLALGVPSMAPPPTSEQIEVAFQAGSPGEVMMVIRELSKGIDYVPPQETRLVDYVNETRRVMIWGIRLTLAFALGLLIAAAVLFFSRSAKREVART